MARNFNFGGRQKFQNRKYVYEEEDDQVADSLLNVDLDSPSQKEQIHTIYVGNVDPESILDEDIFEAILETFAKCGEIVSVSTPDGAPLRRGTTYFFIAYSTMAAAVKACQRHNLSPPYGFLVNHARKKTGTFSTRTFPNRNRRPSVPRTVPRNPLLTLVARKSWRRVSTGASPLQGRLSRLQLQDVNGENVAVCDVCNAQGILIICKYCSKECQELDFTRHRTACQKNLPSSGTQAARQSTGPMNRLDDENVEENNSVRQSQNSNFRDGQFRNNQTEESDRSMSSVQNRLNRSENGFDSPDNDVNSERPYKNYNLQNNENESTPFMRFDNQRQPRDSQNFGNKRNFGSSNNENRDNSSSQTIDFNRGPRDYQDSGDRPRRNFNNRDNDIANDGDYRPRRNFNNRDSEGGDGDCRPRRNFNNRDSEGGARPRRSFNNRDSEGGARPRRNFNNRDSEGGDEDNRPRRNFNRHQQDVNGDRENRDGQRRSFNRDSRNRVGEDNRRFGGGKRFEGGDRKQFDRNSRNGDTGFRETSTRNNADDDWSLTDPIQSDYLNTHMEAAQSGPVLCAPPPSTTVELPTGVYTPVSICNQEGTLLYCAQRVQDQELNTKLMTDTVYCIDALSPIQQLSDGLFCLAKYMDGWYRAIVKQVTPKLIVRFIDYAHDFDCSPTDLRKIPHILCDTPKLGLKIEFVPGSPEKYGNLEENQVVSVMPMKTNENGVIIVKTEDFEGDSVAPEAPVSISQSLGAAVVELEGTQDISPAVEPAAVSAPAQAPVTVPAQAPVTVPAQASLTVPAQGPVTVPTQAPVTVPAQDPLTVPAQAPVTLSTQSVQEAHTEELVTSVPSNENKTCTDIIEGFIVYIVPDNDKEFYVQTVENRPTAEELIVKLHSECPQQPVCIPVSGLLCSALYHNLWYRAKILSVEPSIQVFFIDYGNVDTVPVEQLHVLPDEFKNLPPLCFLVRVEDGTPAELYQNLIPDLDVFKFRIVSEVDGKSIISFRLENVTKPLATVVQTTEQAVGQTIAPVESSAKRKTDYLSSFEVGDVGAVEVLKIHEDFCTVLILMEKTADYFHLKVEINDGAEQFPENPAFVPKIGDVVAVYASLECLWHRGFILGVKENKVLAMLSDAGRIEKVVRVKELSEKYLGYPMLALRQEVLKNNTTQALQEGQRFVFEVSSISVDGVVGSLKAPNSSDTLYEVRLSTWAPRHLDYMDYRYVEFSTVRLQSFCRNIVSVVSASSKDEELYQEMQAILNSHCATVLPMQQLPKIADVVACLSSEGGTYSRGIVKKVNESLAKVKVFCVDTGCEVVATLDKVKPLSLQLKSYPFRANVFKLNVVKDEYLQDEACKLLQGLIDTKTPLRLDGSSFVSEGITLYKSTGECVNFKLFLLQQTKQGQTSVSQVLQTHQVFQTHQVSTPSEPATQSSSNTVTNKRVDSSSRYKNTQKNCHVRLFVTEMEYTCITEYLLAPRLPFKELSIGSCKLFPWLISDDLELFCCVPDPEFVQAVTETMAAEIQEFCENTTETHCPIMQELCLIKKDADGTWYRGVCTKISSADTTQVELVDFGNTMTVENSKIRKMPEKFLTLPRMVVKCTIEGLEIPTDEDRKRLIMNSIDTNKTYDVKVIRLISKGSYLVSFPEILETLRLKSLVRDIIKS